MKNLVEENKLAFEIATGMKLEEEGSFAKVPGIMVTGPWEKINNFVTELRSSMMVLAQKHGVEVKDSDVEDVEPPKEATVLKTEAVDRFDYVSVRDLMRAVKEVADGIGYVSITGKAIGEAGDEKAERVRDIASKLDDIADTMEMADRDPEGSKPIDKEELKKQVEGLAKEYLTFVYEELDIGTHDLGSAMRELEKAKKKAELEARYASRE